MKLSARRRKPFNFTILGFVIPFSIMLIFMICNQVTPFGSRSLLYSDAYHQYYPFFKEFHRALSSGESLLYSWNVGMGVDYLGLISYYLASPLNLFSVFIPESMLLNYFTLLTPIRLGLAGLFFSIFLKRMFSKNDISVPLFGTLYALCAWSLGYMWNVMWLDTFALLPLVILGTCSLLKEKKFFLYTVALFLSIAANYYIGFFVCIFVLLTFICYQICKWEGFKKFLLDLLRIALFSALAICMTAILTLPTYSALQTTQSSVNEFPTKFQLNIIEIDKYRDTIYNNWDIAKATWKDGSKFQALSPAWKSIKTATVAIFDGMKQIAGHSVGGTSVNFKEAEALPNIYCGVVTLILSFVFLTCKQIKLRDKLCSVFLLFFLSLSFLLRQLDYIWHGFHFTNMIPYRFSFLFSFVMLVMAYRAYLLRKFIKPWQIITACAIAVFFAVISNSFKEFKDVITLPGYWVGFKKTITGFNASASAIRNLSNYLQDLIYPAFNLLIIFTAGTFLLLGSIKTKFPKEGAAEVKKNYIHRFKKRQKISAILLVCLIGLEIVLNMANYSTYWSGASISNYPKGAESSQKMFNFIEQNDKSLFYRTETTHTQILNEGALNGYYGISTFTSSANVKITRFMQNLGYGAQDTYNRYCYETASPVPELFLNLKYIVERDGFFYEGPIIRSDTETGEKYTSQKIAYSNPYYDVIKQSGLYAVAENNAYLPLGFLTDNALASFDFNSIENRFNFENQLIEAATGEAYTLWNAVEGPLLSINGDENVTITSKNGYGFCRYNATKSGIVTYSFTADREGYMCLDISQGKRNNISVWLNNNHDSKPDERILTESYTLPQTLGVCEVKPGDVVEVQFECKGGESARIEVYAAILNEGAFRDAYSKLSESTLELTAFSNTNIQGKITCAKDGLLYTSVPQNGENWHVYVDGKEIDPVLVGDVMISIPLTEGMHTITFQYKNKSFVTGSIITFSSAAIFIALSIIYYKPYHTWKDSIRNIFRKKGKYDK